MEDGTGTGGYVKCFLPCSQLLILSFFEIFGFGLSVAVELLLKK